MRCRCIEDRFDALEPPPGGWGSVKRDGNGFPLPRTERIGYLAFESWIDHVCPHPGMVLRSEAWSAASWATLWEWIVGQGDVPAALLGIRAAGTVGGQTVVSEVEAAREQLLHLAAQAEDAFIGAQLRRLTALCEAALAARSSITWMGF